MVKYRYICGLMKNLIGSYECKLDNKGRFAIPMSLKKQMGVVIEEGFVLKRSVFQKCLELIPMSEWNSTMNKINRLNQFIKKNNDFIRLFTSGVKLVESDENGRVLVAKDLVTFADLKKYLVLSTSVGIIEIWDKNQYEKAISESIDDFAVLAEEVMGNINGDVVS